MDVGEVTILRKLLSTLHIDVPERRALPGGQARLSMLMVAAEEVLAEDGFLPPFLRPDHGFDGIVLEVKGDGYLVHRRREVGVGGYSDLVSEPAGDLEGALRAFIDVNGCTNIDGVPILDDLEETSRLPGVLITALAWLGAVQGLFSTWMLIDYWCGGHPGDQLIKIWFMWASSIVGVVLLAPYALVSVMTIRKSGKDEE